MSLDPEELARRMALHRKSRRWSQEQLGRIIGATSQQIGHLEKGNRKLSLNWIKKLDQAFGPLWRQEPPQNLTEPPKGSNVTTAMIGTPPIDHTVSPVAAIDELDISAGAGAGGSILHDADSPDQNRIAVKMQWVLPSDITQHVTQSQPQWIKIIRVAGNSMVPDYIPGDRVMVDTRDTIPSPPGPFIVWDGLNIVIKFVQHLPHSDPPTVRLTSRHPDIAPYERVIDEAYIQGRVIGKWQWT